MKSENGKFILGYFHFQFFLKKKKNAYLFFPSPLLQGDEGVLEK